MAGIPGVGGFNKLTARERALRGSRTPRTASTDAAGVVSILDAAEPPAGLRGAALDAWRELAERYPAGSVDPVRIELAAVSLAVVRQALGTLDTTADTSRALRVIARHSELVKGVIAGQRVIDRTLTPEVNPFDEFDEPSQTGSH